MRRLKVAVLMGGPSPERDVSLATGQQIISALDPHRYAVLPVEITATGRWFPRPELAELPRGGSASGESGAANIQAPPAQPARVDPAPADDPPGALAFDAVMEREQVDVAFIAMHGPYGEDGTIQGLLELLGIPYTGSRVLASALAMDKLRSRQIFEWHRIPVPAYFGITRDSWRNRKQIHHEVTRLLGYPCVVKPNALGSSIGVSLVRAPAAFDPAVETAFKFGTVVLVEEYVQGVELTCGILHDPHSGKPTPLPPIEIVPRSEFYNYEAKYAAGGSEHIIPARVPPDVVDRVQALAVRAHQALGCEGMSRVDLIARGDDIVVLEVNTIPGMTPTSLLPDAARAAGIAFSELLDRLIQNALRRSRPPSGQRP